MERLIIKGGNRLSGTVKISGAKNAVLPVIAATLLGQDRETCLDEVPNLDDVRTISEVLRTLGVKVRHEPENGKLFVDATSIENITAPYDLVRRMRASFLIIGPLLARLGSAKISLPGGCAIGTRPIDLHLKGFEALGAKISIGHGYIEAVAPEGLKGAQIYLDFPSVGATENILMAASMAEGQTVIENPAQEPEIVDLANYLNIMGAKIRGAGTNVIKVEGAKKLIARDYTIIPDRIEAGTYMIAAAMTRGDVYIANAISEHLKPVIAKLKEAGVKVIEDVDGIRVICDRRPKAVDIKTLPYPGFPTDMQAQFMAMLTISQGTSMVTETVFENRFMHVDELRRMGARIKIDGRTSVVEGQEKLTGCQVKATDLRAGAAIVLAALVAEGETQVGYIHHIDRGYDNLVQKLVNLGADIKRVDR
ncbi:MAG: UDP-N-acetylglucosamine 1-carboxyvinyltransferase [Selenomonadaceae bacterium]|nr:UDP-N-acetylglucosamine 1-carboxyvinyltransferase [Selenomonadaceae bacterium]MBQ7723208.1 UDP-N-acetylglucosamine 1-carboxyvinyltransferase [Selenomonadaceae bacterium]